MKVRIFKPAIMVALALLATTNGGFSQSVSVSVTNSSGNTKVKTKVKEKDLELNMENFGRDLAATLKEVGKTLSVTLNSVVPEINMDLKELDNLDLDFNPKIKIKVGKNNSYSLNSNDGDGNDMDDSDNNQGSNEKTKTYTKTYTLDGNDKIKLSNQYGKITVTTWDRREVKVDVQVKAEANDDQLTQKLLDAVQINDSKSDDVVYFKTDIARWNWGNKHKHKLTINYSVFMPARTDLDVEDSYGSIELPDLSGRVKISSSYGSATAQNLSNSANEIEGSYGSLRVGTMNGGKLDFSYGSVNMDECTDVKADLSYGSFKLGKLKGAGDFDLSYVGGFKIDEVASTLKRLNINTSYSGVAMGVASNSNFDFDVTTSYGGFNYDDNRVTITSKNPPDGSKHLGTTRNYKGHVGRGGADAMVSIHTSYGGVNFE
jgi:hypothetical protein